MWGSNRTSRARIAGVRVGLRGWSRAGGASRRSSLFFSAVHHREQVREHHQRHVVVPAGPGPAFKVVQPQFALQLTVTVLDPPAVFGRMDQSFQRRVRRQIRQEVLGRSIRVRRPFHQQPALRLRFFAGAEAVRRSDSPGCEAPGELLPSAFPPRDSVRRARRQGETAERLHPTRRPFPNERRLGSGPCTTRPRVRTPCAGVFGDFAQIRIGGDDLQRAVDADTPCPASRTQLRAELGHGPEGTVRQHDAGETVPAGAFDHLQGLLPLRLVIHLVGHSCRLATRAIVGPALRQIQLGVETEHILPVGVLQRDTDLAVTHFPRVPLYCRATPTECRPYLGNPVSSMISAPSGAACATTNAASMSRTARVSHGL